MVDFWIRGEAGVYGGLTNYETSYQVYIYTSHVKKNEVDVLPVVDLSEESPFFCGQCNIGDMQVVTIKKK